MPELTLERMEQFEEDHETVSMKFSLLKEMVHGVGRGLLPGLIVHGSHGIGKSRTCVDTMMEYVAEGKRELCRQRGHMTPLALYNLLYDNSHEKAVVLLDDADDCFTHPGALNILKAVLETEDVREVGWGTSDSGKVRAPSFVFKGAVIILTNVNMSTSPHYKALLDRVHAFELHLTAGQRLARIAWIAQRSAALSDDPHTAAKVVDFIEENLERFVTDVSIRTFVKIAGLVKFSKRWEQLASVEFLKK